MEFGRPQDVVPGLKIIPFASLLDFLIGLSVVLSGRFTTANKQTKLWLALLGLMVLHSPIAVNNFWAAMTFKDMLLTFLFYMGISTYVDTPVKLRTVINVWLGVHIMLAIFGVLNKGQGVGGWLGDENDFCMEMNVAVPFAYFMALTYREPSRKVLYFGMLCIFILSAMVTLSRGGFIGLTCVGMYCWLKSSNKFRGVLLIGIVIVFMLIAAPEEYWNEVQSSTNDQTMTVGTGAERLYTWGIAWQMFLGNPIIGVGQGNFPWNFEEYQGMERFNTRSLAGRAAHSMYFTLLPELGLIGVGIFVAMLLANYSCVREVRMRFKKLSVVSFGQPRPEGDVAFALAASSALEAAMVGYLASSVFISTLYYPTFWVLTALVVALTNSMRAPKEQSTSQLRSSPIRPLYPVPRLRSRPAGSSS